MTPHDIYAEAKALLQDWYGPDLAAQGACLYWTQCAMKTLSERYGVRVILQAGDMLWPVVKNDDGERTTLI